MQSTATLDWLLLQPKWLQTTRQRRWLCWEKTSAKRCQTGKQQRGTHSLCLWWQPTRRHRRPQPPTERRTRRWRRRAWGPSARSSRGPAGTWREWWGSTAPTPLRDTESRRWLSGRRTGDKHFHNKQLLTGQYFKTLLFFYKQKLLMHFTRTEMYFISGEGE